MYEEIKSEMIRAGKDMDSYGLIALSGGNISVRVDKDKILITPSGMIYEFMNEEDLILIDLEGNIIEGKRKPSVDTDAILYIYNNMHKVNSVIHTHQPYATALGLVLDKIPCNLTTLANATKGEVNVAPYSSAADIDMGIKTVENIGDSLAVVLKHHGVVAVGDSLKQAIYSAVYLEEAAKTLAIAYSISNDLPMMTDEQVDEAVKVFDRYGQSK